MKEVQRNELGLIEKRDDRSFKPIKISVLGIGNGGVNVLNKLTERNLKGVRLVAADTDTQSLQRARTKDKILMGEKLLKGFGAGFDPEKGKAAAEEVKDKLEQIVTDSDLLVTLSMLGKGTGSGATPVVLDIAKEKDVLSLALVVTPSDEEGLTDIANKALREIADKANAYMPLSNEVLDVDEQEDLPLLGGYDIINSLLADSIEGLVNLMGSSGYINSQVGDVRSVLAHGKNTVLGLGVASGENRAQEAVRNAIERHPIITGIPGAKTILIFATIPPDFKRKERKEIVRVIKESVILDDEMNAPQPRIIWSILPAQEKTDKLTLYIIAAGIEHGLTREVHHEDDAREVVEDVDLLLEDDDNNTPPFSPERPSYYVHPETYMYDASPSGTMHNPNNGYNIDDRYSLGSPEHVDDTKRPFLDKHNKTYVPYISRLEEDGGPSEFDFPPDKKGPKGRF